LAELDRRESEHDEYGNHWITVTLGMLAFCRGDLPVAEQHLERAVREFGRQRSSSGQMESMMYLGWIALDLGKERRARMLAERSLAMARQETDVLYEATNLWLLARLALRRGELAEARAFLEASTDVARRRRESVSLALALFVWADLAAHEGEHERSARLFGAARQALAGIPHIMPPSIGRGYDETIAELRRSIGEKAVEALGAAGAELPLEEAVEYALSD
jgi:non-specific serine/threonine protein kinase